MLHGSSVSTPSTLPITTSLTGLHSTAAMTTSLAPILIPGTQPPSQTVSVLETSGMRPLLHNIVEHQNILRQPGLTLPCNTNNPNTTSTIVVINNNNPVQLQTLTNRQGFTPIASLPAATVVSQALNSSILSTAVTFSPSPNRFILPRSSSVPQSSSALSNQPSSNLSTVESGETSQRYDLSMPMIVSNDLSDNEGSQLPTFEELCRPIMEAEIAAGSVIPVSVEQTQLTCVSTPPISTSEPTPVMLTASVSMNTATVATLTSPSISGLLTATASVSYPLMTVTCNSNDSSTNRSFETVSATPDMKQTATEIQSEIVSSTTPENAITHDTSATSVVKGTLDVGESSRETCHRCLFTPTLEVDGASDGSMSGSAVKSVQASPGVRTPKSALEMMAAYAPIFLSPQQSMGSLTPQQLAQETTPQKPGPRYVRLLPKPTPPSSEKFDPAMFRKSPKSASPRRRQFNQQAKAILPKGFVISTFETSPAKKAASTLVDKAKLQAIGYCNILPRPPGYQAASPLKMSKTRMRTKQVRKNLQSDKSFSPSNKPETKVIDDNSQVEEQPNVEFKAEGLVNESDGSNLESNADAEIDDKVKVVDTDSDFTQSEDEGDMQGTDIDEAVDTQGSDGDETQGTDGEGDDGNDTQGTDLDSQDESQEEDEGLIADLMTASTTLR